MTGAKTVWAYIQDIFKMYSRYIQGIFKMYSRYVQDGFKIYSRWIQDIFKIYSRFNISRFSALFSVSEGVRVR